MECIECEVLQAKWNEAGSKLVCTFKHGVGGSIFFMKQTF